jgi:glycosyltransferase involved in cell wall biosynthesis
LICCFVPTNRPGGIDVLEASIMRQTLKPTDLIIADELAEVREKEWNNFGERLKEENISVIIFKPQQTIRNAARNLVAAYNEGVDICRGLGYKDDDLFISLQDYIYVPDEGIERFFWLHTIAPDALLTGVTDISIDPFPNQIKDINGHYTIFKEPYTDKPSRILWEDPRPRVLYNTKENKIISVDPEHWEANWAAIPFKLFNMGARWSEIYDTGYAYENMDFALKCSRELGAQVLMDAANCVISLPHKEYWPNEVEDLQKFNNRTLYEKLWK